MKQVQDFLQKHKLDAAILKGIGEEGSASVRYFTGYDGPGALFIPKKGTPKLIVNALEFTNAKAQYAHVIEARGPIEKCKTLLPQWRNPRIAVELDKWTIPEHRELKAKYTDLRPLMREVRMIKLPKEIRHLRFAAKQTSLIFNKLVKNFNFRTESELAAWIDYEIKKRGGTPSFPTIVASGKNGAKPHHTPQDRRLQKGFCVLDFGMRYKGYCADMTRTIFIGTPSKSDLQAYDAVRKAHAGAVRIAAPGVACRDLDAAATKALGERAKYFIHSLGHGIGLEVHEAPRVSSSSDDLLQEGMCFTIEPGIYYPKKFGIRIEDDFVVTKTKVAALTNAPRHLITL